MVYCDSLPIQMSVFLGSIAQVTKFLRNPEMVRRYLWDKRRRSYAHRDY